MMAVLSKGVLRSFLALAAALGLAAPPLRAATDSAASRAAEAQFRAANPCPVTGQAQGTCTGYVVDRVIPILCGGAEHPDNMRWLTLPEAKAKARWERVGCRPGRKLVLPGEHESVTESFALDAAEPIQAAPLGRGSPAAPKAVIPAPAPTEAAADAEPAAVPDEVIMPHE